jgi:hypothetical protein
MCKLPLNPQDFNLISTTKHHLPLNHRMDSISPSSLHCVYIYVPFHEWICLQIQILHQLFIPKSPLNITKITNH